MAAAAPVAGGSALLPRVAGILAAAVAVGVGVLAFTSLPAGGSLVTSYATASAPARALGLLAGCSVLAAGALAVWFGPTRAVGMLLLAAGILWFAPDWAGWEGGPGVVRGIATLLTPLLPVALFGLVGTLLGAPGRRTVAAVTAMGVLSAGLVAVDDPFLDPVCWPTCSDSALLISSQPELADVLGSLLSLAWVGLACLAVVGAVTRLVAASPVSRRWSGVLFAGIAAVGAVEVAYGLAQLVWTETADDSAFVALHLMRAVAWFLLASAAVWTTQQHLSRRRSLTGLAAELETTAGPGSLAGTLRSVTGDPDLDVRYPVGADERQVGADGRTLTEQPGPGRTATPLRRGDRTVAILVHDPAVLPVAALDAVLGPAARLALDNERLAAERLARGFDVQESQRRIVRTGDEERRRLERDLHDGAQQSLLALSYRLRLTRTTAERAGEWTAVAELDRGLELTQGALDDLRRLAHGIHPAVLAQSGLAAALRALADESPVPLELEALPAERFDPSVELAAWVVVRDTADRAALEQSDGLVVQVDRVRDRLVVEVTGAGGGLPTPTADRVGALGGSVFRTVTGVRVELPCGS
jgi:signal transduction histidine kinase